MTREEREVLRSALIERKRQLADRVQRLSEESTKDSPDGEGEISAVPTHPADLGTDEFERDQDLGLADRAAKEVGQIDEALTRMESADYGTCERCGRPISLERLRLLPWASLCAACQAAEEAA